jgi:hypothetical protein
MAAKSLTSRYAIHRCPTGTLATIERWHELSNNAECSQRAVRSILGPITLVDFSDAATYDAALANPEWVFELQINAGTSGDINAGVAITRSPQ